MAEASRGDGTAASDSVPSELPSLLETLFDRAELCDWRASVESD